MPGDATLPAGDENSAAVRRSRGGNDVDVINQRHGPPVAEYVPWGMMDVAMKDTTGILHTAVSVIPHPLGTPEGVVVLSRETSEMS
jgi:hypothetical protein